MADIFAGDPHVSFLHRSNGVDIYGWVPNQNLQNSSKDDKKPQKTAAETGHNRVKALTYACSDRQCEFWNKLGLNFVSSKNKGEPWAPLSHFKWAHKRSSLQSMPTVPVSASTS
ncbi:unnamed protein product [Sphenostylis stenocarpa]|uniref:Uncharacterized protein n=1 Tax=Sphenostylis stenocarpa TaxID=92480 RepID=A0AA86S951_9FABA|nr:unnamed protein product [Sphenostylis stenocarpa]